MATLETDTAEWDLQWLDEGYTMVGVNATIIGPPFTAPSGSPQLAITYRLNSMDAEIQYLNMYLTGESNPGVYSCQADFWGMSHGNAPIIYMGARVEWVDIDAQVVYAIYESHPDSMLEIHMPYAVVTGVNSREGETFTVYPSITTGSLSLKGYGDAKRIEVIDLYGRVVLTTPAHHNVDVSHLSPGHYFLRTESGHVHRFVKG